MENLNNKLCRSLEERLVPMQQMQRLCVLAQSIYYQAEAKGFWSLSWW